MSNLIIKFFRNIKLDSWSLKGKDKNSQKELNIFYAGLENMKNYFCKIAYNGSYEEKYLGRLWIWNIFRENLKRSENYSLTIIETFYVLNKLFMAKSDFIIPRWISAIIDISGTPPVFIKNKSIKNDIRRINKNKLIYQLTREDSQFDYFYYNMHKPYINKVHGDRAFICEYNSIKKRFKNNADLLLIKKENEFIAGSMIFYKKNQGNISYIGVKDGNLDYVKNGAIQAIFYFATIRFKEKGFNNINFGLSRPFLNDSILRYKKKWHPRLVFKKWTEKVFLMKIGGETCEVNNFLINNPFVYVEKNNLNAAIFIDDNQANTKERLDRIYKYHNFSGISKICIYRFTGEGDGRLIAPTWKIN